MTQNKSFYAKRKIRRTKIDNNTAYKDLDKSDEKINSLAIPKIT